MACRGWGWTTAAHVEILQPCQRRGQWMCKGCESKSRLCSMAGGGGRALERRLAAGAERVEGVQAAAPFPVIPDSASLGRSLQLGSPPFLRQLFLSLASAGFSQCQEQKANGECSQSPPAALYPLASCGKTTTFILTPGFTAWGS